MQKFDKHVLKNGLVVLGEPIEGVNSAAFDFLLPAGASRTPELGRGTCQVVADWIFRGAGDYDSRGLNDAMDSLGLQKGTGIGSAHITIGAAMEHAKLEQALELYAEVIRRPKLSPEQFTPARQLAVDQVKGLEDDPRKRVMVELKERFYPEPLGTNPVGRIDELEKLQPGQASLFVQRNFNPAAAIVGVAGKYDFDKVCDKMEKLFGDMPASDQPEVSVGQTGQKYTHIAHDGAQVHLGLMTPTVLPGDADYYKVRLAISVLSGGMSSRLFTEVREKRGLCYAVGASYDGLKTAAGIGCYAGTTPDKAQQTLDVIMQEFARLKESISEQEMARARAGLKSAMIMQGESSSSRAMAIGGDYYMLGRIRDIDEIREKVDSTTAEDVMQLLSDKPFEDFTVLTIGPKEVKI